MAIVGAIAAVVGAVVGAALGGVSAAQQADTAKKQAEYQTLLNQNKAKEFEINRQLADRDAKNTESIAKTKEDQRRRLTASIIGQQRSSIAGSGFDVGVGSALDVIGDTAEFGELDALNIRFSGQQQAFSDRLRGRGFQSGANAAFADSALADFNANAFARDARANGISTALTSATTVASKWYQAGSTTSSVSPTPQTFNA
jgi:hypothetical protein